MSHSAGLATRENENDRDSVRSDRDSARSDRHAAGTASDPTATVQEAEAALDDIAAAATFVETGGRDRLRRVAERTDDEAVRERAPAVLGALDRLGQATGWRRAREGDRGETVPRVTDEPTRRVPGESIRSTPSHDNYSST